MCNAVHSVFLCLDEMTAVLSNFINSEITSAEPFLAAIWAHVLPSFVAADTQEGLASNNINMTVAFN